MTQLKSEFTTRLADFDLSLLPVEAKDRDSSAFLEAVHHFLKQTFASYEGRADISVGGGEARVVWSRSTDDPDLLEQAVRHLLHGRHREAVPVLELMLSKDPDNYLVLHNLGMALCDQGLLKRAITCLGRAVELCPGEVNSQLAVGVALTRYGAIRDANEIFVLGVALHPDNLWAHRHLGTGLMREGEMAKAMSHFERAASIAPSDQLSWIGLAQTCEALGDNARADEAYGRTIELDPFSEMGALAKAGRYRIAPASLCSAASGTERMAAVMYCLGAIGRCEAMSSRRGPGRRP